MRDVRTHMRIYLALFAGLLGACAAPGPSYDPAAKETQARIVGKRIVDHVKRPSAEVRPVVVIPAAGTLILVEVPRGGTADIAIYEYTVETSDKSAVKVFSDYSAFDVGQCVTLFTANQPTYPRIASGSGCK